MKQRPFSWHRAAFLWALLVTTLSLTGCGMLIADFDQVAYQNATSLKAETLFLMDKSPGPYPPQQSRAEALEVKLRASYEYAKGIPKNELTTRQWDILIRSDGDLIGQWLKMWRSSPEGLNPTFVVNMKGIISDGFDEIICLEANKKQATKCSR